MAAGIAKLVQRLATGWTVRGSNPGRGPRFSAPVQTGPGAHPVCCTMDTGSFQGVKRPGRDADPPPHLQCRGLKLGRAIPLPILRALVACKGGTFTFTIISVYLLVVGNCNY